MTWRRLLSHPYFLIGALIVILALSGGLASLATIIATALMDVFNKLLIPILAIGIAVYAVRRLIGGGRRH